MSLPATRIRVLVVDDHAALREGVVAMCAHDADIEIVGQASNGDEAVAAFETLRPHVMLLDLVMPARSGIDVIEDVRRRHADARIIVRTTYEGDAQAVRALKAGAAGYLLKSSLRKQMLEAIRTVHAGRRYILAEVAQDIALHAAEESLSARELVILQRVAEGKANKIIARELAVSEDTVKAHLRNIFAKLHVNDRTQAVTVALRRGMFTL
jgi:DNA-binding NarL/FixJ family response regulator